MELSDAEVISAMKRKAISEHVWAEVQQSFQECREAGYSVREAAASALYDWDC